MYQSIHEAIQVVGVYRQRRFKPVKFQWQQRVLPVDEITMETELRDGGIKQRMYSVVSGGNVYRLLFNRDSEEWWLEEVWCE